MEYTVETFLHEIFTVKMLSSHKMFHTTVWKSQLSTGNIGVICWPKSITDGAPGLIVAQLHSSLVPSSSSP